MLIIFLLILAQATLSAQVAVSSLADAGRLYSDGKLPEAIAAYRSLVSQDEKNAAAQAGLIRSLLKNDDFQEAHEAGLKAHHAIPSDACIRALLGDVFYRMADFENSYRFYLAAVTVDRNYARAYWGTGRVHNASFRRRSARAAFVKAYELDPEDPDIIRAYAGTLQKDEERVALLEKFLGIAKNEDPRRLKSIRFSLEFDQKADKSKKTELRSLYQPYKLKLDTMMRNPQRGTNGIALRVSINGAKPLRLQVDTGASGVIISRKAAERSGLEPISSSQLFGIGNTGDPETNIAVADSLKVGDVEFANFPVEIAPKVMDDTDGLIGTDVFSRFLVTLNLPGFTIDLLPLPDYADGNPSWNAHDRVVPKDAGHFVPIHRVGHLLLVQTLVNNKRAGYFALDTGANLNLISEEFAQKVTHVGREDRIQLKGLSGKVKNVYSARNIVLQFGHFTQENPDMVAFNMHAMNKSHGIELAGLLGWTVCSQLITTINYRDGLISFTHPSEVKK